MAFNRLRDIAEISSGFAFKSSDFSDSAGIPVVRISNINNDAQVEINIKGQKFYPFDIDEKLMRFLVRKGDVLIALSGATTGKIGIYNSDKKALLNQRVALIRGKTSDDSRYLYYALLSKSGQILNDAYGGAQPNISPNKIGEYEFYFPAALNDRNRITDALETQFTRLDAAIKSLKTIKAKLETYRQSVLMAAFKGNNHWSWTPFASCGTWTGGGTPSKFKKEYWNGGTVLWVSSKDMKVKDIVDTEDKITREAVNQSSAKFIPKDSLIFVVRSGILRRILPTAIARKEVTVNQDLQAFTPAEHSVDFLYWFTRARNQHILRTCSKSGTTVESIETSLLKKYEVPVCPLKEQKQVVDEIESRFSVIDKVEEAVDSALLKTERLRKSILKAAFEGKLVNA